MDYISPVTGSALYHDTAHSLASASGERWPIVDGIAYLRVGSGDLVRQALAHLDRGDPTTALLLLLSENDRWWTEPPPTVDALEILVRERSTLSLRAAMDLLGYGRVGTYFAHRWSDPTFMAGLALIDSHWTSPKTAFDLACGIGHYVRAMHEQGVAVTGADIVFSKLWIARHWVVGDQPTLVCFDVDGRWPITDRFDLVTCQDAFYFFADKAHVAIHLKLAATDGQLAIGHIHDSRWAHFAGGASVSRHDLETWFPHARIYDDQALTRACADRGSANEHAPDEPTEAVGLVFGSRTDQPASWSGPLRQPADGVRLVRNPLCVSGIPTWPSARYRDEYAARATYACTVGIPDVTTMAPEWAAAAARRDVVALPERW